MTVAFDHREAGTAEELWEKVAPWAGADEFLLDREHVIVVAAHPDDETLGAGGLLAQAASRGIRVSVVVVTDGEGSHPSARNLALRRRGELLGALHDLTGGCPVHFLGIADGGVREAADELRRALRALVGPAEAAHATVVSPWWGDGHRDHRVVGEVAAELTAFGARVLGYPIWYWHWGIPEEADVETWRVLELDEAARTAKRRALARYVSQREVLPDAPEDGIMLHTGMLRHFARGFEVFIEAVGAPQASTPVGSFDERYARHADPWGVDVRWYERRKRELLLAALPRERFARALEIGCGTGALTERLAERCDDLVALDVSPVAVTVSRERLADVASARVENIDAREALPPGPFDLVVLSELAYYWSVADLETVVRAIARVLAQDGIIVLCHWRHPISDAPLTGDEAHTLIAAEIGFASLVRHEEGDFLLEVLARPGTPSVARETGIVS